MAIIGVQTGLTVTVQAVAGGTETGLNWWMDNGTTQGASNALGTSSATSYLGKSLNFIGNKAAARVIQVALNKG